MGYRVIVPPSIEKQLDRLPPDVRQRITKAIKSLESDPHPKPPNRIKLKGREDSYRYRVGQYRIIYTIEKNVLVVVIVKVAPRGSAYKD